MIRYVAATIAAVAIGMMPIGAAAQDKYPSKIIHIVVGVAPGGLIDVSARLLAKYLQPRLGQPIIIDNKPGANTTIGANAVLKAPADGYTLFYGGAMSASPIFVKNGGVDFVTQMKPVSLVLSAPFYLLVSSKVPAKSIQELSAYSKKNPLNYADNAPASALVMNAIAERTGLNFTAIPYKGSAPSLNALIADEIEMTLDTVPNYMQHIKSGKVRAMMSTGRARMQALPDVPTGIEAKIIDFNTGSDVRHLGTARHARRDRPAINDEIAAIAKDPEFIAKFREATQVDPLATSPAELLKVVEPIVRCTAGWPSASDSNRNERHDMKARSRYDVVVVGGGAAGVAAALGSARQGARTLLVERYGFLGGAATNSLVLTYCGFYVAGADAARAVGGVGWELLLELQRLGSTPQPVRSKSGNWLVMLDVEAAKFAFDNLVSCPNWTCVSTRGWSRRSPAGRITSVRLADHAGLHDVEAAAFVDASGEASLSAFAGATLLSARRPGRARAAGIASSALRWRAAWRGHRPGQNACARGSATTLTPAMPLHRADGGVLVRLPVSEDLWWMGIDLPTDGLRGDELATAEIAARRQAWEFLPFLREMPGFDKAFIVATGPQLGIRETRRPRSLGDVTGEDGRTGAGARTASGAAAGPWRCTKRLGGPCSCPLAAKGSSTSLRGDSGARESGICAWPGAL